MPYNKEWYAQNKERMKAYRDQYKAKNAEKVKQQRKKDYAKHKERMATDTEYKARYYETLKRYRKNKPEVLKKAAANYKAKLDALPDEQKQILKDKKKAISRRNYEKSREKQLQKAKDYYQTHKVEISEKRKKRYAESDTYNRSWRNKRNGTDQTTQTEATPSENVG